jgi:hypothetical protein
LLTNSALVYEPKCEGGGGELQALSQCVQPQSTGTQSSNRCFLAYIQS